MTYESPGFVYLVDDSPQVQMHLAELLRHHGYGVKAFGSAEHFLDEVVEVSPAVIVLDMRLPHLNGLELQARLQARGIQTPIIFISGESHTQEVIASFRLGAADFLWKPFPVADLIAAIDKALVQDRERESRALREAQLAERLRRLTPREREVMRMMVDGYSNKGIAEMAGVAADTIKKYRAMIFEKLGVEALPELITMCRGTQLLDGAKPPERQDR